MRDIKQFKFMEVKKDDPAQDLVEFPLGRKLSINGTVFNDLEGNGFKDIADSGICGWTVKLMRLGDIKFKRTKTDNNGRYFFDNLPPGNYIIKADKVAGWNQTIPGDQFYIIILTDKDSYNVDFGNFQHSRVISLYKYNYFPVMHLTQEKLKEMQAQYDRAGRVQINVQSTPKRTRWRGERVCLLPYLTYVAKDRNQGQCGNCWVWAGTGAMEIEMAVHYGVKDRLSIQWFNSNYQGGKGCGMACCGSGTFSNFAKFYKNHPAIPWSNSNASWLDGNMECNGNCSSLSASISADKISRDPSYSFISCEALVVETTGIGKEASISNIKDVLKQNKPVLFSFVMSDESLAKFKDFWLNESEEEVWSFNNYYFSYYIGMHSVLCIGYDDSDPQNRYWIMVNSYPIELPQCPNLDRPKNIFLVNMDMDYNYRFYVPNSFEPFEVNVFEWWCLSIQLAESSIYIPNTGGGGGPFTGDPKRNYAVPEWQDKPWIESHIHRMQ